MGAEVNWVLMGFKSLIGDTGPGECYFRGGQSCEGSGQRAVSSDEMAIKVGEAQETLQLSPVLGDGPSSNS